MINKQWFVLFRGGGLLENDQQMYETHLEKDLHEYRTAVKNTILT